LDRIWASEEVKFYMRKLLKKGKPGENDIEEEVKQPYRCVQLLGDALVWKKEEAKSNTSKKDEMEESSQGSW
jgi:hypothetical protein